MPIIPTPILIDKGVKLGDYHSWWLPSAPKDAEQWSVKERWSGSKVSIGHRCDPDGKYREGGPFYTLSFRTKHEFSESMDVFRKDNYLAYRGLFGYADPGMYDYAHMSMYGKTTVQLSEELNAYGAQAHARLRPDRPDFTPFESLGELAFGLADLQLSWQSFRKRYNKELSRIEGKVGHRISREARNYLAASFGVTPLITDCVKFLEAYSESEKRLKQLVKDNGKWVRRRALLTLVGSDTEPPQQGWWVIHPDTYHPSMLPTLKYECYQAGTRAYSENKFTKHIKVWAVGKSKYWLPSAYLTGGPNVKKLLRRIDFNTDITLVNVYNLMPWSWLIDYFFNFGSFFASLSGGLADTLIFDYAYIMREEKHVDWNKHTESVYTSPDPGSGKEVSCTIVKTGILRSRGAASLFGFGYNERDLSPTQWSILGALGLSRLP